MNRSYFRLFDICVEMLCCFYIYWPILWVTFAFKGSHACNNWKSLTVTEYDWIGFYQYLTLLELYCNNLSPYSRRNYQWARYRPRAQSPLYRGPDMTREKGKGTREKEKSDLLETESNIFVRNYFHCFFMLLFQL